MSAVLGVPEHARAAWDNMHDQIRQAGTTPCAGPERDRWTGAPRDQAWAADQCLDCPALRACLAYATTADERDGVWGGTLPAERHETPGPKRPGRTRKDT